MFTAPQMLGNSPGPHPELPCELPRAWAGVHGFLEELALLRSRSQVWQSQTPGRAQNTNWGFESGSEHHAPQKVKGRQRQEGWEGARIFSFYVAGGETASNLGYGKAGLSFRGNT